VLDEQIAEYASYANTSIAKANCAELRSVILLYGEHRGYKAIYIDEQPFDIPVPIDYTIYTNTAGKPAAYEASDIKGLLYKLMNYSEGSANFNKRFDCTSGFLFVWPSSSRSTLVTDSAEWTRAGNYALEI
jgi:hypothetical protein